MSNMTIDTFLKIVTGWADLGSAIQDQGVAILRNESSPSDLYELGELNPNAAWEIWNYLREVGADLDGIDDLLDELDEFLQGRDDPA